MNTFGFRLDPSHPIYQELPYAHITGNRSQQKMRVMGSLMRMLVQLWQEEDRELLSYTVKGFEDFGLNKVVILEPSWKLRSLLSCTDNLAVPERNNILYQYHPEVEGAQMKVPHISLGKDKLEEKMSLFKEGEVLRIHSIFIKEEGGSDPFFTLKM